MEQTPSRTTDVSTSEQRPPTAAEQRANEHAGTTDTEVLARDIAQTREELSVTIDAIVDRVSPKKVVERGKQQARENVQEATETVKGHASTAAGIVKEKALVASEVVKEKVAELKDKASGGSDATPVRSPLAPATSVSLGSATPVTPSGADAAPGASPLPSNTVSVDAGELPPPEPAPTTTSDLPSHRPVGASGSAPVPPAYAGAGAAALLAGLLLLLRRRRNRRRRVVRRR